jgi:predicted cupin superfamily sugar epimerase
VTGWAAELGLAPHPEGGWFRETWRSAVTFTPDGYPGPRSAASAILFLLNPGERSRWHVVRSDELWFWHRGGELTLTVGTEEVVLGPGNPQVLVPANTWQKAEPHDEAVLVSCVVAPGFDFADFQMRT